MAEEYVKTSAEELTAMADYLRQNGDFEEGQKFIFPSSEYDQNPVYTYKIIDNGAWEEITATEASQLIEQSGYSIEEVNEFPDIQEALANTIYYKIELGMGFKEAYQKYLDDFYDKIAYGTLKQEDLAGVVYSEPLGFFRARGDFVYRTFPNITEITVSKAILSQERFGRLGALKKVKVVGDSENSTIGPSAFSWLDNLEEINFKPTVLSSMSFAECSKLKFGPDFLDLSECIHYMTNCLYKSSIKTISIAGGAIIEAGAFRDSDLETVYLPDDIAELKNIDAFEGTNPTFWVSSDQIKNTYLGETNWCAFDSSKFQSLTQG